MGDSTRRRAIIWPAIFGFVGCPLSRSPCLGCVKVDKWRQRGGLSASMGQLNANQCPLTVAEVDDAFQRLDLRVLPKTL